MSISSRAVLLLGLVSPFYGQDGAMWVPARVVNIEYPLLALQSRTQGAVSIECVIAADGSVSTAKVVSGSPLLGGAVLSRIGEWRFRLASGASAAQPPSTVTMTVNFVLEKPVMVQPKTKFIYDYPNDVTVVSQPLRRTH